MTFTQALKAVLPHASTNRTSPVLCAVSVHPDRLIATDRFTFAISRFEPAGELFEPFILDLNDAKRLVRQVGTPKVVAGPHGLRGTRVLAYPAGTAFTITPVDAEFPDVESLLPGDDQAPVGTEQVAFNGDYLARFSGKRLTRPLDGPNEPIRLTLYGPRKPVVVRFSDHFVGAICPVRWFN